eukprot:scaffold24646_cov129-Isochrysis_galbana.AAC.16
MEPAEPLPMVQKEAPIGGGESISQREASVRKESEVSRNGPNSWNRPNVDGAPGPPLYQMVRGIFCQSGAIAQM